MSAVAAIRKAVGLESKAERERRISELGHAASRTVEAAQRSLSHLKSTPVTLAQFLRVEPVHIGLDFAELDRLVEEMEQTIKTTGKQGLGFAMSGDWHTLDTWLVQLREARSECEPYRNMGGRVTSGK